jgi:type I restriction enzyme S subunit
VPVGWKEEALHDQADWVNGAAYKNMHFSDAPDALPVVKIAELKSGVTDQTKRTNTQLGDKFRIADGELLFSWSGNPDTSIDAFIWAGGPAWLNQHVFAVRPNGKQERPFLYVMLKHFMPDFARIARDKQTTGLGHVTKADMQRMRVCVGSTQLRKAFNGLASPIFERLVGTLFENNSLETLRNTLLPRLISGELRIRDAESAIEAA